jgi:hypothetical protein
MKQLVAVGLLVATVALAGVAFAGEGGGRLMQLELEKLFEWSAQAAEAGKQQAQTAGPGTEVANPVPPYQEYPGYSPIFEIN